jgi:hypothetical protein
VRETANILSQVNLIQDPRKTKSGEKQSGHRVGIISN